TMIVTPPRGGAAPGGDWATPPGVCFLRTSLHSSFLRLPPARVDARRRGPIMKLILPDSLHPHPAAEVSCQPSDRSLPNDFTRSPTRSSATRRPAASATS